MNSRTAELRKLMREHALSAADVGALLGRTAQTVRVWRCRKGERVIPDHTLTVLKLKVAERAA